MRRTIAHEYGLPLFTVLPVQAYSRKYVAGATQTGGGGSEGDSVTLHCDEETHTNYHYSCVVYLNTQGDDFEGGNTTDERTMLLLHADNLGYRGRPMGMFTGALIMRVDGTTGGAPSALWKLVVNTTSAFACSPDSAAYRSSMSLETTPPCDSSITFLAAATDGAGTAGGPGASPGSLGRRLGSVLRLLPQHQSSFAGGAEDANSSGFCASSGFVR